MVEFDSIEEVVNRKMDDIADFIFGESQENIIRNGSVDTGNLLKSGNVNRKFLEKEIVYSAPYASSVEFGAEPHSAPVEPLIRWADRKLGLRDAEARRVGWAIRGKILKEGVEEKPFLRPAIKSAIRRFGS